MAGFVFLVFMVLFMLFLFGLYSIAEGRSNPLSRVDLRRRTGRLEETSAAAHLAMKRAGYDAGPEYVQTTDVGLLAYRNSEEPKLVRYSDVVLDTHYLRPFAELWLPYAASGPIRFEIIDSDGRLRYADEVEYNLTYGLNTLLPNTWLPLKGKTINPGRWTLRVMAGNTLLAVHVFGWQTVGGGQIQRYVHSDGEISTDLMHAMQVSPRENVSLSDLLNNQED